MEKTNKVRDKKAQIVRLDDNDTEYIINVGRGTSFNESVKGVVGTIKSIEAQGLAEVAGVFDPNEWLYLAKVVDSSNSMFDRNELIRQVAKAKNTIAVAPLYDIDVKELTTKLLGLGGHQVFAIVERIHQLYSTDGVDENEWANF